MNIPELLCWVQGTILEPDAPIGEDVDVFISSIGVLQHMHDGDFLSIPRKSDSTNAGSIRMYASPPENIQGGGRNCGGVQKYAGRSFS